MVSSGTPSEEEAAAGIHVRQARDVTLQAGGDIVAGNKTTIIHHHGPTPRDITKGPYKFLSYYDISDRDIFFGRDAVIEELAGQIPRHKVVILNGQSGSGKTSLINAGLIPRLAECDYLYLTFRDYSDPLQQLRDYLNESPDFRIADVGQMSLLQIMRAIRDQQQSRVVVIFDQFERFFVGVKPETRRAFLQELKQCTDSELTADEMNLVFSLRQDFFGQLVSETEAIIPTFLQESHHHNLRPLNHDEARQAILAPLKDIPDVSFDISFVDKVLLPHLMREAGGETGIEPPHLQIVCNQLYGEARQRCARQIKDGQPALIGNDLYDTLGKAKGMLRGYLDDVVHRIAGGDAERIGVVRSTLKLMIETVGTRRFVSVDAICDDLPDVPRDETVSVIDELQEARVVETRGSGDDCTYSLSHEIMVAKVESWFDQREMLRRRAQETLERGLAEWNSTNALLNEEQVQNILRWLPDRLLTDAERLLDESTRAIEAQKQRAAEQQQKLELAKKRTKTARRIAIVVTAILIPASVGFGIWATINADRADREAGIARKKEKEANDEKLKAKAATIKAEKNLALSYIERGMGEIDNGNYARGVSQFFAAYSGARTKQHEPFPSSARNLIGGWSVHLGSPVLHDGCVVAVAFSPDGKTVLTGSWDKTARLWDAASGEQRGKAMRHRAWVAAVAFSPDGKTVLTGSYDKKARLWDAASGEPRGKTMRHRSAVVAVAFSPDEQTVLTGSADKTARLWDAASGEPRGKTMQHQYSVVAVAFSPDGKTVLTGSDDQRYLRSERGEARLWDAVSGEPCGKTMQHKDTVGAVAFSPDGKTVLTGSEDKTARLWDAVSGEPRGKTMQHEHEVVAVAFSPDGKTVLTGSYDKTARLWDAASGEPLGKTMQHGFGVVAVAFSPDGKTVLTGSRKTARLWDVASGEPRGKTMRHREQVDAVAFSPDGKTVLTGSGNYLEDRGEARLWDATSSEPRDKTMQHGLGVGAVAFSPDGKTVLTGSDDKTARLWDAASGQQRGKTMWHEGEVWAVAFSPDGKTVLTGSDDDTARLWDARGEPLGKTMQHEGWVVAVAFSPDGETVLTGSWDDTARLWDAASGKQRAKTMRHDEQVVAVAFSPDGKTVLTGSYDKTARLWDAASGEPLGKTMQHKNSVGAVAFSPDGKTVLTADGGEGGTVQLWDAASGEPHVKTIQYAGEGNAVVFSPDGKTVLTGSADTTARLWDAASG